MGLPRFNPARPQVTLVQAIERGDKAEAENRKLKARAEELSAIYRGTDAEGDPQFHDILEENTKLHAMLGGSITLQDACALVEQRITEKRMGSHE